MKLINRTKLFWFVPIIAGLLFFARCDQKAITIENNVAQLFVDDYLVETQQNLKRTLHQPIKDYGGEKPIIALDKEFEDFSATLEANGTIVFDPRLQKYVMFALGFSPNGIKLHPERLWEFHRRYRFTSKDGIHWTKGDDGTPQWIFPRSKADLYDPASDTYASNVDAFCCYYDKSDPEFPYKGWQHYANWGGDREGFYFEKSSDGIFWQRGLMVVNGYAGKDDPFYQKILQDGRTLVGVGDVSSFYHDPIQNRFLGLFKFYSPDPLENGNRLRSRAYAFFYPPLDKPFDITQINHVELLPPAAKQNNDMPYDEYYGSTAWRYESLWLGGLKIWHSKDDYPWSAAGGAFLKLVSSRDGLSWSKVGFENEQGVPEVFIPNGPEGGNGGQNDGGYITEFTQGPLRIGDELIFYYGCSSWGKNQPDPVRISGGGIFRARLRIDGFVSVDAGELTTRLLSITGNQLIMNADGPVTIKILNSAGKVLASQTITGNSTEHHVLFNGKTLGQLTKGKNVRLHFAIGEKGKLYSYRVKE